MWSRIEVSHFAKTLQVSVAGIGGRQKKLRPWKEVILCNADKDSMYGTKIGCVPLPLHLGKKILGKVKLRGDSAKRFEHEWIEIMCIDNFNG